MKEQLTACSYEALGLLLLLFPKPLQKPSLLVVAVSIVGASASNTAHFVASHRHG